MLLNRNSRSVGETRIKQLLRSVLSIGLAMLRSLSEEKKEPDLGITILIPQDYDSIIKSKYQV